MTVKFMEYLSAGISVDKFDPLKIKYYRLKLAIEGYASTILRKNGQLSELISELQPLFNGTGEQSEGDFYAIASQVRRLAAVVRQLDSSLQRAVLKGNDSQIARFDITNNANSYLGGIGLWLHVVEDLVYVTSVV
ncbi:uncharacterized protein LOC109948065 [Prunus persica]|uniref:uncharacterized protein LOC109948065 n=1 Tax=Prunus persica TaxID=3760 RepID=UPI0009ABA9CB|nr:uncharacterized protein LOC109948065 [Prunus persica]